MQETEKIWMNGELVDWADAKVHVGVHGLHYGSGVFEGIRCYDTPKGPAVFRLGEHMQRLHNSARLLYMQIPFSVDELKAATNELVGANGLPECYIRPIAFYGYGQLGVAARGNPVETVIMSWPWGSVPRRGGAHERHPREDLVLAAHSAERRPARLEGDRRVPQLDARGDRGEQRRLRRGDPADARGDGRGRLGREHLRRARRRHLHAGPRHRDPAGHHARHDHADRAGPRLHGRREAAHPLRPLPRRRGVHVRHRRRGDAAPVDRRPRDRRRPGHAWRSRSAYLDTVRGQSERWSQWLDHVPQLARS